MGFQTVYHLNSPVAITFNGTITPKGEYDGNTAYVIGDSVSYSGSSYVAIQNTQGHVPTETAYWQILASKGDTGPEGSGFPAGGTDGQVLTKQSSTDYDADWEDPSGSGIDPELLDEKTSITDGDKYVITDSEDSNTVKLVDRYYTREVFYAYSQAEEDQILVDHADPVVIIRKDLQGKYRIQATQASYTITPFSASLDNDSTYLLQAEQASYTILTTESDLRVSRRITATQADYVLTRFDADLIYAPTSSYTLTADKTDFTISSQDISTINDRYIMGTTQSYTITGQDAIIVDSFSNILKTIASTNLKAYYEFESGALTTDSSGNSHTLTEQGSPSEATGIVGGCVSTIPTTTTSYTVDSSDESNDTNYWKAQAFTAGANPLSGVTLRLKKAGSPTGFLALSIQSDSSGSPSGTDVIILDSINVANLTTSYANYTQGINAITSELTNGNTYHVVAKGDSAWTSTNDVLWASEHGTGFAKYNYGAGSFTSSNTTTRQYIKILENRDSYAITDHADLKPTGSFSFGAWIKNTNSDFSKRARMVFQSYSQNTNRAGFFIALSQYTGTIAFFLGKNTGTTLHTDYESIAGSTGLTDTDTWHFVVCTYDADADTMNIYLDGSSDATPVSCTYGAAYAATNYVRIGERNVAGTPGQHSCLDIDEAFLINGLALSSAEVSTLYNSI